MRLRIIVQANRRATDQGCQASLLTPNPAKNLLIDRAKIDVLPFGEPHVFTWDKAAHYSLTADQIIVLTGFNTDVEHDGVIYHVQTEDKGLSTPLILSLVYTGGAILASKRSPYQDLIDQGFDEDVLAERIKRQHRLICAAIAAGRVEDLKQMGARDASRQTAPLPEPPPAPTPPAVIESAPPPPIETPPSVVVETAPPVPSVSEPAAPAGEERFEVLEAWAEEEKLQFVSNAEDAPLPVVPEPIPEPEPEPKPEPKPVVQTKPEIKIPTRRKKSAPLAASKATPPEPPAPPTEPEPYVVFDSRRAGIPEEEVVKTGLRVKLINEHEFRSGESLNLNVIVTHKADHVETPVVGASVSFKVLGTTFRPIIVSLKTGKDGKANIKADIPKFASGRAAILVRAAKGADAVEIRRVVYPG